MFGWFRHNPRCPLAPDVRAWIEARSAWIVDQFGADRLRRTPIILPTAEFFPETYRGTEDDARRLHAQVSQYMGVAADRTELQFFAEASQQVPSAYFERSSSTLGLYQENSGKPLVWLERSQLADPFAIVATLAHELAHVHLLGDRRLKGDETDHEPVTDLLTVFLGLGIFNANTTFHSKNYRAGHLEAWSVSTRGYLTEVEYAYAFALLARLRGEERPPWAKFLRPNVLAPMAAAERWLRHSAVTAGDPNGARFDQLVDKGPPAILPIHPRFAPPEEEETAQDRMAEEVDSFTLGAMHLAQGEYEDAVRELSRAIADEPDDVELREQRAKAYLELGQFVEAADDAQRAIELAPDNFDARFLRGRALLGMGSYPLAVADLTRVIDEGDTRADLDKQRAGDAYYCRGLARHGLGQYDAAVEDFTEAIQAMPYRSEFYAARAAALEELGSHSAAQRDRARAAKWKDRYTGP